MAKLPGDVDLTLKMDFNDREGSIVSVKLPKEQIDTSYKRYHKYKRPRNETTYYGFDSSFSSGFTSTTTSTTTTFDRLSGFVNSYFNRDILEVEERVCWRDLYYDPDVFGSPCERMNDKEIDEYVRNLNFPLGSREDRAKAFFEIEQRRRDFSAGFYCDCCGKKLNKRNCLSHIQSLCASCNKNMSEAVHDVRSIL